MNSASLIFLLGTKSLGSGRARKKKIGVAGAT
jgi:hypothetical protein